MQKCLLAAVAGIGLILGLGLWLADATHTHFYTRDAKLIIWHLTPARPTPLTLLQTHESGEPDIPQVGQRDMRTGQGVVTMLTATNPWQRSGWTWLEGEYRQGVLFAGRLPGLPPLPPGLTAVDYWVVLLPWWWFTVLAVSGLVLATVRWERRRQQRARRRNHQCLQCGYSRLGLPETTRCPECGTAPAPVVRSITAMAGSGP